MTNLHSLSFDKSNCNHLRYKYKLNWDFQYCFYFISNDPTLTVKSQLFEYDVGNNMHDASWQENVLKKKRIFLKQATKVWYNIGCDELLYLRVIRYRTISMMLLTSICTPYESKKDKYSCHWPYWQQMMGTTCIHHAICKSKKINESWMKRFTPVGVKHE